MAISIVIITGNQLRHRYFVNRLNERFDLRGVISEPVFQPTIEGTPDEVEVFTKHFAERDEVERRFFGQDERMGVDPSKLRKCAQKGEANSPEVFQRIVSKNPDFLILYGSSIIRAPLLHAFDRRCLNMHLGLSPYYRGSGTNFWPLVNREPELVGVTIHLATLDVDGGPILKQIRPTIELGDRNHEIGCKAIIAGTSAMIASIEQFASGTLDPKPQSPGGRLYRRKDFNVEAVRRMGRNLDTGMIAEYLAEPGRARRYPIIE